MRPCLQSAIQRLVVFWVLSLSKFGVNAAVNVTVDDSDPSILYLPDGFWSSNSDSCLFCLHPDASLAHKQTYHYGSHVNSVDDDDTITSASSSSSSSSTSSSTSTSARTSSPDPPAATGANDVDAAPTTPNATPTPTPTGGDDSDSDSDSDSDDDDDNDDNHGGSRGSSSSGGGPGPHRRTIGARIDEDDPGFIDSVVTAQFKFTGTDVFLYGIEPLFLSDSPHTPTAMNLTFTLDNVPLEPFVHDGTESSSSDYAQNILVFSQRNLDDKPHVLLVTVQPETSFIFDYMVYTSSNASLASLTTDLPAPTASSIASSGPSKHNIATFAGAVAGSVGALGTVAFCIFLSICRRRRISARRERRQRRLEDPEASSEGSSSSGRRSLLGSSRDAPRMIGPRPFVPRYFPGTVLPPSYDNQNVPYNYADPEDIDAVSTTSVATREGSMTTTSVSTAPLMTQTTLPILTIPNAPPPVYNPSPNTSNTHSHSAPSVTSPSAVPTSTTSGNVDGSTTYADVPPTVPPPSADQLEVPLTTDMVEVPPSFGEAMSSPPVSPVTLLHESALEGIDSLNSPSGGPGLQTAAQNGPVLDDPEHELPSTASDPRPASPSPEIDTHLVPESQSQAQTQNQIDSDSQQTR